MSERKGFKGPGHLVSGAKWIPGTARATVNLSHCSNKVRILQIGL
jgi:hypothetical protein